MESKTSKDMGPQSGTDISEAVVKKLAKEKLEKWNSLDSISPLDAELKSFIASVFNPISNIPDTPVNKEYDTSKNEKSYYVDQITASFKVDIEITPKYSSTVVEEMKKKLEKALLEYGKLEKKATGTIKLLKEVSDHLRMYITSMDELESASRTLVADQGALIETLYQVSNNATYFIQTESIRVKLYNSNYLISNPRSFYDVLDKIDGGMTYMLNNPRFKEGATYLENYRTYLYVALNLVKTYISNVLNAVDMLTISTDKTAEKSKQPIENITTVLASAAIGQTSPFETNSERPQELDPSISYHYGKFQALALKIQPLINQVERRSLKFNEYKVLLEELQQLFIDKRYELMEESIIKSMEATIQKYKNDRSLLFRTACSLFIFICQDEHQLYYSFFSTKTDKLQTFMSNICSHLYDHLRPVIVQIEHIEILCELCTILKLEVLNIVENDQEALEAFGQVVTELLRDIQERLVFRSHIYFRMDILNYKPSAGDLAYPEKLKMMLNIVTASNAINDPILEGKQRPEFQRADSQLSMTSSISQKPLAVSDLQGMWYPTIRRALQSLSRLYRCVDVQTFQGLSQEAVSFCVKSITNAGYLIGQRSSTLDGYLFQISHLLILREQIAAFQVDFTTRETTLDFTKTKEAASNIMRRKNLFTISSNNAIIRFLLEGAPQIKEQVLDSKKDADLELKVACLGLISHITKIILSPLEELNQKIQVYRKDKDFDLKKFRTFEWSQPDYIAQVVKDVIRNIKSQLQPIQHSMNLYIHNKETEAILFRPIRNNIIGTFVQLEQLLSECYYEKNELIVISCPSADQVSVMLSLACLINSQESEEAASQK